MDHRTGVLMTFLEAHAAVAGPVVGLLSLIEGIVLIGAFVPLSALLVASGAAIAVGRWSPDILAWSVIGVSLGNLMSYELGRRLPEPSRQALAARAPKVFARARRLFAANGAGAVVFARFVGPPASAPFLAGYLGLSRPRFVAALAVSALWVPTAVALGYLPAKGLSKATPEEAMLAVVVIAVCIALAAIVVTRLRRKKAVAAETGAAGPIRSPP